MDTETAYQEALTYLYSFVDYSMTRALQFSPEKFDLSRMERLLERLGNPQQRYPIVHVAGTKGKGSTAAMIASVLTAAGYRVGFYTSPHLQDFSERMQLDGRLISHRQLADLVAEMKPVAAEIPQLTTFELTTAAAFLFFARQGATAAVIEVGLGGRLDATNVVSPLVSVITSISYDHMNLLGSTLGQIAAEKAGIIKPGRPVVSAPQKMEALEVIEHTAESRQSALTVVGRDVLFADWTHQMDGQTFLVWRAEEQETVNRWIDAGGDGPHGPVQLRTPLLGYHQVENAATAYAALLSVREAGLPVEDAAIQRGFADVFWPGRFEVLRQEPPVVVDSAHNRDSALRLRLAIEDYLPGRPVVLLFGASEDKDLEGMFAELLPRVRQVVVTESFHPRAAKAEDLAALVRRFGRPVEIVRPARTALQRAMTLAGSSAAVVVAGSLFISAEARDAWQALGLPLRRFATWDEMDDESPLR